MTISRRSIPAFLAFLAAGVGDPVARSAERTLRVMTFNVRLPVVQDGDNAWELRRDLLVEVLARARPDIIGAQELYRLQGDYMIEHLPGYAWFGQDRRGGHADEHMGIFYRRDRLRLIDMGNFGLSDTPNVPGSITWGHLYPRSATWGLFEDKATGGLFHVLNTHLPYRPEDEEARCKGAALIAGWIEGLPAGRPVVLLGDFNAAPQGGAYATLTASLVDARTAAPVAKGPDGTFHGFTGEPERRIDWILTRGFEPRETRTITTSRDGRYPSDHFPVLAILASPANQVAGTR